MFRHMEALMNLSATTAVDIFNAGTLTAFFSAVVFVAGYSVLAPWWRYKIGWSVTLLDITIGLVLVPRVLTLLFNVHTTGLFFTWYRVLSLFAISGVTLWRLWLVAEAQREMLHDIAPLSAVPDASETEQGQGDT